MTDFVRVKDALDGREYTLPRQVAYRAGKPVAGLTILDRQAVDKNGAVLPPKFPTHKDGTPVLVAEPATPTTSPTPRNKKES